MHPADRPVLPQRETPVQSAPVPTQPVVNEPSPSPSSPPPPVQASPSPTPARPPPPRRMQTRSQAPSPMMTRGRARLHRSANLSLEPSVGVESAYAGEVIDLPNSVSDPLMAFWSNMFFGPESWFESPQSNSAAKVNTNPDLLTYDKVLRAVDKMDFLAAMDKEIEALELQDTWEPDLKRNATNGIVPCHWVLTYKRTPEGEIKKRKARIVLRGDLQEYTGETFSPVAAWPTVRAFLVLSHLMDRYTCTIDYSNAFVQSPLPADQPVWMHVPRGYQLPEGPDYCLRLKKSLYGHVAAPRIWWDYLTSYFKKFGFTQSEYDPCLWYNSKIMLVQYVDDIGISAVSKKDADDFIELFRKEGLTLTQEESFSEFLGIKFDTRPDGSVEMTQKGLISKILKAADMEDCNPNSTPAAQAPLGSDKEGAPMKEKWNYRAIVGMLLYLSTNTRPDITFAVSQVARFSHEPKQSHATAVKTILRYLKGTKDKGTKVSLDSALELKAYVDADFAGLFRQEDERDSNSVRSRTGYIILFGGWPLLWKSQLQSHLSQSTTEAEYSALSSMLKTLIPLKWLLGEMLSKLSGTGVKVPKIIANVFEDNQSAYYLATNQRITSRTK